MHANLGNHLSLVMAGFGAHLVSIGQRGLPATKPGPKEVSHEAY
ncbi:MAG: hypothetical protein RIS86_364, partial [Planctomycetota bacterium]